MKKYLMNSFWVVAGLALLVLPPVISAQVKTEPSDSTQEKGKKRPYFEYKGNYGEEVEKLKNRFKADFGYELLDLDRRWAPDEIKKIHAAFAGLPPSFLDLKGFKGLYRVNRLQLERGSIGEEGIFAGTFPRYNTVYRQASGTYNVEVQNEPVRIEFYNDLFYLDPEHFNNIVHHEMAHAYDLTHGFLSFQRKWLDITGFHIVHIPALDGKPRSDFIFMLADDPKRPSYGPVSSMQMITHSRENPQEDFANSVAGYLHYPYFRYTHPRRYDFIKEKVFGGTDVIPHDPGQAEFPQKIVADFKNAVEKGDWTAVKKVLLEAGRQNHPQADKRLMDEIESFLKDEKNPVRVHQIAVATCYLYDERALLLRQKLWLDRRIDSDKLLKEPRCVAMGKDSFQKKLSPMPVFRLYFFKDGGEDWVQFLDPVVFISQARGFRSKYKWRLVLAGDESQNVLGEGETEFLTGSNGAVKFSLQKTKYPESRVQFPEGRPVNLLVWAERMHPRFSRMFPARPAGIQFVVNSWFRYKPLRPVQLRVVYPPGLLHSP